MILLEHILFTSKMSAATPLNIYLHIEHQQLLICYNSQPRTALGHEIDERIQALQERYNAMGSETKIRTYVKENRQYYIIPLFNSPHV